MLRQRCALGVKHQRALHFSDILEGIESQLLTTRFTFAKNPDWSWNKDGSFLLILSTEIKSYIEFLGGHFGLHPTTPLFVICPVLSDHFIIILHFKKSIL